MKSINVGLNDDTYNYLEFLERTMFIKSKEDAVRKALIFFKKLSMHDWLPDRSIDRLIDYTIYLLIGGTFL